MAAGITAQIIKDALLAGNTPTIDELIAPPQTFQQAWTTQIQALQTAGPADKAALRKIIVLLKSLGIYSPELDAHVDAGSLATPVPSGPFPTVPFSADEIATIVTHAIACSDAADTCNDFLSDLKGYILTKLTKHEARDNTPPEWKQNVAKIYYRLAQLTNDVPKGDVPDPVNLTAPPFGTDPFVGTPTIKFGGRRTRNGRTKRRATKHRDTKHRATKHRATKRVSKKSPRKVKRTMSRRK